jgi:hypothetical protein
MDTTQELLINVVHVDGERTESIEEGKRHVVLEIPFFFIKRLTDLCGPQLPCMYNV